MIVEHTKPGYSFHMTITPKEKGEVELSVQFHKHGTEILEHVFDRTVPASKAATMMHQILREIARKKNEE